MGATNTKSFLRWAGSKKQLLPILSSYWPSGYTRYVEPFSGSACLHFNLAPYRALLGDINKDLIETYHEVKGKVEEVIASLAKIEQGRESYLRLREEDTTMLVPPERAARFIFLNRFCFNGLYRTNSKGKFNVPYGGDRSGKLPTPELLRTCSACLKNARLIAGDFEDVLDLVEPGDFVYMDPPFRVSGKRVFNEYDRATFSVKDIQRLRVRMEMLESANIPFLVSYAECDEAEALRQKFHSRIVTVKRNISGFAHSRGKSNEILIWNRVPDKLEE